eukprot:m.418256 g.418256  ORF g.418256 m.418256 type:complete len:122 (+) comp21289_c0_seq8:3750-4115(+)
MISYFFDGLTCEITSAKTLWVSVLAHQAGSENTATTCAVYTLYRTTGCRLLDCGCLHDVLQRQPQRWNLFLDAEISKNRSQWDTVELRRLCGSKRDSKHNSQRQSNPNSLLQRECNHRNRM